MMRTEFEHQLRWMMAVRLVIVTTMLFSAFVIELAFRPAESLRPLFVLAATAYGAALLWAFADRWFAGRRGFLFAQLTGDALIVTFFVQITGGPDSPMSFLYLLPVAVAATAFPHSGAAAFAAVCWGCYAALTTVGPRLLPTTQAQAPAPGHVIYMLVSHGVAMLAVGLLAASLAQRVREQGHELVERRGTVARLQALNENIIESINSGLLTTDQTGRVNFINRGGTEIIGLDQAAVEGRAVGDVLQLGGDFMLDCRRKLATFRRFRFERWFSRGDALRLFIGIAVSDLYDKTGRPLGHIFIFQDLTEIHALEQEVRLNERMAALGEMAAGMAHELRNPLAAISGSVQYLKGDLRPQGETLELMDIILRESQRLDRAIHDFLTFARPGDFDPERVDLTRVIDDCVRLLRNSPEFEARHDLRTSFETESMDCDADADRLKQVFWNLATNALKAMPGGGRLSIDVRWRDGGERVEVSFADEGSGMDEAALARYFQPFSSSFPKGTGLGAAIVYRLVEEHKGKITLDSAPGAGTRVRIVLPRRQPNVRVVAEPVGVGRASGGSVA